jgi:hypothetical protein
MNLLKLWTLPIETVSEGNQREHWHKAARRHTKQKDVINLFLKKDLPLYINQKITVKLIRIAPRKLDEHDNLRFAFKWVVDAIASLLKPGMQAGQADSNEMITWEYGQEKGKPKEKSMRVEIYES